MREETHCHHMGYSFWLAARVLLYAPCHRQDSTYHSYTSRGALAGTRNSSMGPLPEGSIWWPITPWANALTTELHLAPNSWILHHFSSSDNFKLYFLLVSLSCPSSSLSFLLLSPPTPFFFLQPPTPFVAFVRKLESKSNFS